MVQGLEEIQSRVGYWSQLNFGDQTSKATGVPLGSLAPLMGVAEELGELFHATLKRHQGIRGFDNDETFIAARNDAVADILVYLCDYASREGFSLLEALNETWDRVVSKRNWKENPAGPAAGDQPVC